MVVVKVGGQRGRIMAQIEERNKKLRQKQELQYTREVYKKFDADNSGAIDADEFRLLCEALGYVFESRDAVEKAVQMIDEDKSGEIEWEEFAAWWQSEDKFSDFEHLLDDSAFYRDAKYEVGTVVEEENEEDAADWPKSILHPFAVFRTIWDSISAIAIVYSAIFVPYRMAFELVPTGGEWWFDRIVDISFMIDIPLTFNTAYYDAEKEEMVTDRARINENYLKGWFVPDFLATFPFDSVGKLFVDPEEADSLRVLKMIRLLRLLKIMRIVKMSRLLTKIQEAAQIKSGIMFSIKFSLMCSACAHYLACGWYLMSQSDSTPWVVCQLQGWRNADGSAITAPSLDGCDPGSSCPGCVPHFAYTDAAGLQVVSPNATVASLAGGPTSIYGDWVLTKPLSNWVYRYFIGIGGGAEWQTDDPCNGAEDSIIEANGDIRECFPVTLKNEDTGVAELKYPLGHVPKKSIYIAAFYWSITTMTTLGYGEINASDQQEMRYVLMSIAIGCVIFAYGITNMCTLVANLDAQAVFAQGRSDEIIEWMTTNKLTPMMKKKVLQYFTYKTDYSPVFYYGGAPLINELSPKLQNEVRQSAMVPLLLYSPLFQGRDPDEPLLLTLSSLLEGHVFGPAEDMVEMGVYIRGLYLVVHGTAAIFDDSGGTIGQVGAGESYGELGLREKRRAAQRVQATSFLDVYLLPQAKFLQVCKKDRIEMDTVFEWDKVDNVVRDVDTEAPEKAIDGIPESELELRKLRAQCVEQEDMIVGLLDSIENVDHLLRDDSDGDGADTQ